jgi:LmbE family N-acetylglucosaminyl deacetylase
VRGAYDLHIHVEPDVIPRKITDLELARRYQELGLAGFVLKSHYVPTAERAAVVRAAVPEVRALGALVLNNPVGGLNPIADAIAARGGARIVWMPTVDAANEASEHALRPAGAKLPLFEPHQPELCGFVPNTFLDITPVFAQKEEAMAAMAAQGYLRQYYHERAEHRANHARRISGDQRIRYAEAFMRALPQVVGHL